MYELRSRGTDEWEVKRVNKVLLVGRRRMDELRELLGIWTAPPLMAKIHR